MSRKRVAGNVCLLCQLRRPSFHLGSQSIVSVRFSSKQAQAQASAISSQSRLTINQQDHGADATPPAFNAQDLQDQFDLHSVADAFRSVMLDSTHKPRSQAIARSVIHKLSNAAPNAQVYSPDPFSTLFSAAVDQTSHDLSSNITPAEAVDLIRLQLQSANTAADIARIFTVHLKNSPQPNTTVKAQVLATDPQLVKTLKSRLPALPPDDQLALLGLLASRFSVHSQTLDRSLMVYTIHVAAITHSLPTLYQFLRLLVESAGTYTLSPSQLVALSASLKIGLLKNNPYNSPSSHQLGAITQLLFGPSVPHTLNSHIPANHSLLLAPWLDLLVITRAKSKIWGEWILAQSGQRWHDPDLSPSEALAHQKHRLGLFILAFFRIGAASEAWKVFKAAGKLISSELSSSEDQSTSQQQHQQHPLDLYGIHRSVWAALLTNWSSQPQLSELLQRALHESLLTRFEYIIDATEQELGVTWQQDPETGDGRHTLSNITPSTNSGPEPDLFPLESPEDESKFPQRFLTRDLQSFKEQSYATKLLDLQISRMDVGISSKTTSDAEVPHPKHSGANHSLWMDPSMNLHKQHDALQDAVLKAHADIGIPTKEQASPLVLPTPARIQKYCTFLLHLDA